ncbi:hypothetical protein [Bradyrhizobium sp. AUGA SZCCT0431]|uniref:hypothetical protein n=1 Tax=Bradyrhizobium sp. AUGA SZCCT0431 TaxID=2807674 RepID=UPI001BABD96D|nr:hypothetical protein [Bradyrhizobium sp. AUGA SZCCT0431]MBR1147538.1 hypothetical protein [Bradyrhizobium sp. AUGA SZCCT0431]
MIEDTLDRVQRAFLHGRHRPPSNAYAAPGKIFAAQFKDEVSCKLQAREIAAVEGFWQRQGRGLSAAKKGDLEQSQREFRAASTDLEESELSEQAILLVRTLLDPAQAYYHYLLQDYGRARELVLSAAATNHRLVEDFGVAIISAQRMQLCHNILRITTREGRREETVRLAAGYLNYLEHNRVPLPGIINWAHIVRDFPDSIVQFYFDQVCGEAALAMAGSYDCRAFSALLDHVDAAHCSASFSSHGHSWITITRCKFSEQIEEYLDRVCALLELGKTAEPSIWLASVFDVAAVCRELGSRGRQVADRIYREMESLPDARWIFQDLVLDEAR